MCIYEEDVRIGKEVLNHFHILSSKNGNANLGLLLMKAMEVIAWKNI